MAKIDVGDFQYDSFTTLEKADEYLAADILRSVGWAAATEPARKQALVSATRLLLRMPWAEVPPFAGADPVVQEVTAMLAADLMAKPKLFVDASGRSNVKSVRAGSASVDFFSPAGSDALLPLDLWTMLVNAGLMAGSGELDDLEGAEAFGVYEGRRPLTGRYPGEYVYAALDYDG